MKLITNDLIYYSFMIYINTFIKNVLNSSLFFIRLVCMIHFLIRNHKFKFIKYHIK
jgi:hypothetical protein